MSCFPSAHITTLLHMFIVDCHTACRAVLCMTSDVRAVRLGISVLFIPCWHAAKHHVKMRHQQFIYRPAVHTCMSACFCKSSSTVTGCASQAAQCRAVDAFCSKSIIPVSTSTSCQWHKSKEVQDCLAGRPCTMLKLIRSCKTCGRRHEYITMHILRSSVSIGCCSSR